MLGPIFDPIDLFCMMTFFVISLVFFCCRFETRVLIQLLVSSENCPVCKDSLTDGAVIQVHEKGADGINAGSVLRGDSLVVTAGCNVHVQCRKRYVNKKDITLKKRDSIKL